MSPGRIRVGTAGYQYDDWAGRFYPETLPKARRFEHYTDVFDTVEINNTFYGMPEAATFEGWREQAPEGFLYALKFSRYGTHLKHLKDPENTIAYFLDRARYLDERLGPILVQLPPRWRPDPERLRAFLTVAPAEVRWTVELREASWLREDVLDILREFGAALCIHDLIDDHPWIRTTDWMYVRYHGDGYAGSYSPQRLSADADRLAVHLAEGRDVYAYFNNTGGDAVKDALRLRRFLERRVAGGAS